MYKTFALLMAVAVVAGCATDIPEAIRTAPPDNPDVAAVRASIDTYVGARARWGGTIAELKNREKDTLIEVVARPLGRSGRPQDTDRSEGRFMLRVPGFIDPAVFKDGRAITAAGTIEGAMTRTIGEFPYRFPVLKADAVQLWEPLSERQYYPDPFWPYHYPGYPWRYPYYPDYYPYRYY